jgi:hypothetical protein
MTAITTSFHFENDAAVEIEAPAIEDVLKWIRDLDGCEYAIVSVTLENGLRMHVGGGSNDQYQVSAHVGSRMFDLESLVSTSMKRIPIVVCEDLGHFPERVVVTREQALTAMRHFCEFGTLAPE